jgi:hypothetical protein
MSAMPNQDGALVVLARAGLALAVSALCVSSLCVSACATRPRTQVLVEVTADPAVRARLSRVSLRVQGFDASGLEAGPSFEREVRAPLELPITLAVVPRGQDATRTFLFEATGFEGEEPIVVVRARSGFRAEQTLRLALVLEDACVGVSCAALETCRAGACVDAFVDPATLTVLGADASIDAPRMDAGALSNDDAAASDAAGVDAWSTEVVPDALVDDAAREDAAWSPDAFGVLDASVSGDAGPCGPDPARTYCPGERACFDLRNDDTHCGSCDDFCVGGRTCEAGQCLFESTGAEGPFRPSTSMALTPGVHHFTVINIPAGVVITTSGPGVLDLRATGSIQVNGTIDVSGGDGADGIDPTAAYGGSGGGGATGHPSPAPSRGDGCGAAGVGGEGEPGGDGTSGGGCAPSGGRFGGGAGGTWDGGASGGGGRAGGGGGAGGARRGGAGGAVVGEEGGAGGDTEVVDSRPHGTGGRGGQATAPYAGTDGREAPMCRERGGGGWWSGGGGGGSIGRAASDDLTVTSTFHPGSGGGGGGSNAQNGSSSDGGAGGGGGGGAVRLSSPVSIAIGASGRVLADGGDGGGTTGEPSGAGGGGSGGIVYLAAPAIVLEGRVSARAGRGGVNTSCGADGGDGGPGRIRMSVDPAGCTLGAMAVLDPPLPSAACEPTGLVPGRAYLAAWPD